RRLAPALLSQAEDAARGQRPDRQAVADRRQPSGAGPRRAARARLHRHLPDRLEARCDRRLHPGERAMNDRAPIEVRPVVNESGLEVQPLYTAADVEASGGLEMLGQPGEYPFTRGIHPLMYRKQPWTMRQYAGFGN